MGEMIAKPASKVSGEYLPPGDKSISHRLVMLGSLAEGTSVFTHFLEADDCLRTIKAFEAMGVSFKKSEGKLFVNGIGVRKLNPPKSPLDLGNSGTTMRLLLGILAGQNFEVTLTGDASLTKRPMRRVTEPLRQMGAQITGTEDGNFAPLTIKGGKLTGIHWVNQIASAQVKSAILLAGLNADGETSVEESIPSRDHTERLLTRFGVPVERHDRKITVRKAEALKPFQFQVPGDISSAAFFMVAAAITPGSDVVIKNVGLNPSRSGIIDILKAMGADISVEMTQDRGEPMGDIHMRGLDKRLQAVIINKEWIPNLIDELPILMIACALAEGRSVIRGAKELRVKETDRINSMAQGLKAIGGKVQPTEDGCIINGVSRFQGGAISSFGDHRTAMSFAIAALQSEKEILIQDTDCIMTSYPGFEADLAKLVKA
ncbi:MAG: 3-phosphoshikimate 1-carboxyvinyltransferase [Omnitrophica bacterium RIFCSPLOWO2_12_FULL_44_17]|uniref:3-phosphoshikimate 1-carboxyvinyltransferase n=1 Tax=Candidatus Danuiimicrobium aquiferis TaxID=1801832 RepID=A0A1G1KQT5_9BACT|nr:MAG: 3-phosphoshikimate 1-carboxyvinyltransferase [Omnitrophica bacterium RIFCSPHIGHO2_02_FULL_45_28]OGW95195.1 MAG: 3-phosphoshikimate 1-carboxyvinyltransferase [Omnitrophica bacterium RIFCSPLOWO2_12_FULL_44_17]OGX01660.1 MAG: 3-phosphoshikimate 1-carboxyvinyltransferase [Omnitrophica bacterium RIFCSPLOWO2_02_FULL_44_11]